jgi:type II secretory pathway pseudopilin PulG
MSFEITNKTHRQAAFTYVEVLAAMFLMLILSTIVVTGMIMYGRMSKGIYAQHVMTQQASSFLQKLNADFGESVDCEVITSGGLNCLSLRKPVVGSAAYQYVQYLYHDSDNQPNTIRNNRIYTRTVNKAN